MSVQPIQFICDSCGAVKRECNNWIELVFSGRAQTIELSPMKGIAADKHACGIPCALKLAAAFLEPILSQKGAAGIPLEKP